MKTAQDLLDFLVKLQETHNLEEVNLSTHDRFISYFDVEDFKPELHIKSEILFL